MSDGDAGGYSVSFTHTGKVKAGIDAVAQAIRLACQPAEGGVDCGQDCGCKVTVSTVKDTSDGLEFESRAGHSTSHVNFRIEALAGGTTVTIDATYTGPGEPVDMDPPDLEARAGRWLTAIETSARQIEAEERGLAS
jgi:hypothetical protein